jgi:hypothetical protein
MPAFAGCPQPAIQLILTTSTWRAPKCRRQKEIQMVRKVWSVGVVAGFIAMGTGVWAQQGPGNPLAALQQQIDVLAQQVAGLAGGVQGGAESSLVVIRGTVGGNAAVLQGAGFQVSSTVNLPCGFNLYPEYHVTFDQAFASTPSIVVSARDAVSASPSNGSNAPVFTAAIDGGPNGGGVTVSGFSVRIKTDAFGFNTTCFGSQNWDFIAIGPR